ncbi:peroxidase [Tersicoccus solisilvae]|uniref:Deferrochelatase n=1 Tax=Tersicoccus solisilvae TaxID=1882339 RepID=A0ABQ1NJP4_9MICC|nr:iron uptake transporter deferrochelatase/peroxidase subunit [Tersicoccus solisilvae]GGC78895.1 peroxidase [Tersicoccus solisilvae]
MSRLGRRSFLTLAGTGGVTAAVGAAAVAAAGERSPVAAPVSSVVPFHGAHQAGIVTPAQDRLHLAAFDVVTDSRDELIALLQQWTEAAATLTAGGSLTPDAGYDSPPTDTGEALGLSAANLTITIGFGAGLFRKDGKDRFGLAKHRPAALIDLPHFPGDALEPARTGGDLVVQACADDPQVAVHAIRNLARIGFGTVSVRWSQLGFGRTASTSTAQATPRNLFGFKDGTANLKAEENDALAEHVWVGETGGWMAGGTYLVARRIRMHIETWDRTSLREQEQVVGRDRTEGAPLSGGSEFTEPDLARAGNDGTPLIATTSHVALAHPSRNDGVRMLRRGYNYTDGSDGLGRLDAGLMFLAFVTDPRTHYVPMQTAMARNDALAEYLRHTGSGLFAVPGGVAPGGYVGQRLFEA